MAYDMHHGGGGNLTGSQEIFSGWYPGNGTDGVVFQGNGTRTLFYPRRVPSVLSKVINQMENVGMPVALCLGIVANVFIVCIFLMTPVGRNPLSIYLTAIGLADLTYLLCSMILWVSVHGFDIYNHTGMCQLTTYALFLSLFLATWYLVSAHLERCLWHFGTRRRKKWCTKFRSKCIIITISIFSMVAYLYALWTHILLHFRGALRCMPMPESLQNIERLRKVEIVFSVFIPMVLIILIDIVLLIKCATNRCCGNNGGKTSTRSVRMSTRVSAALENSAFDLSSDGSAATMVCVICGVVYVIILLPAAYLRVKLSFPHNRNQGDFELMRLFENVFKLNSVYKFFLYMICLRSFRKGFVSLFTKGCAFKKRRDGSGSTKLCACRDAESTPPQETNFV